MGLEDQELAEKLNTLQQIKNEYLEVLDYLNSRDCNTQNCRIIRTAKTSDNLQLCVDLQLAKMTTIIFSYYD